jgi:hypothetical protein
MTDNGDMGIPSEFDVVVIGTGPYPEKESYTKQNKHKRNTKHNNPKLNRKFHYVLSF